MLKSQTRSSSKEPANGATQQQTYIHMLLIDNSPCLYNRLLGFDVIIEGWQNKTEH